MNKRDRVPISRSLSAVNPSIGVCKLPSPKYAPVTIRGVSSTTHCQSKTGEKTGEKTLEGMNIIQRSAPFDVLVERVCGKILVNFDGNGDAYTLELLQLLHKYTNTLCLLSVIERLLHHHTSVHGALALLHQWCSNFFHRDFDEPRARTKLYTMVIDVSRALRKVTLGSNLFYNECMCMLNKVKLQLLRKARVSHRSPRDVYRATSSPRGMSREVTPLKPTNKNITAHSAMELAQHFTRLEHILFSQIPLEDFAMFPKQTSPKLKHFIERFNNISQWAIAHISRRIDNPLAVLKYFIKVARYCEKLHNYNTSYALLSCFGAYELKPVIATYPLPRKYRKKVDELEWLFDPIGNFRAYRAALRRCIELRIPFLPYMGIFLKDLTAINDANPDWLPSSLKDCDLKVVNVDKIELLGSVFRTIRLCHTITYDRLLPPVNRGLYDALLSLDVAPAKNINRMSLSIRNKKLMDAIAHGDGTPASARGVAVAASALPHVCSSGTLTASDGPANLSTFMDFLAKG